MEFLFFGNAKIFPKCIIGNEERIFFHKIKMFPA